MTKSIGNLVYCACENLQDSYPKLFDKVPYLSGAAFCVAFAATMVEASFMRPLWSKEEAMTRANKGAGLSTATDIQLTPFRDVAPVIVPYAHAIQASLSEGDSADLFPQQAVTDVLGKSVSLALAEFPGDTTLKDALATIRARGLEPANELDVISLAAEDDACLGYALLCGDPQPDGLMVVRLLEGLPMAWRQPVNDNDVLHPTARIPVKKAS